MNGEIYLLAMIKKRSLRRESSFAYRHIQSINLYALLFIVYCGIGERRDCSCLNRHLGQLQR